MTVKVCWGCDREAVRACAAYKCPLQHTDPSPTDAQVMAHPKVRALVEAVQRETEAIGILAAGLEPRRQHEIENGSQPETHGEKLWASVMRLRAALRDLEAGND